MRLLYLAAILLFASCSQTSSGPAKDAAERPASRPDLYRCDGCEVAEAVDPDTLDWRIRVTPEGEPGEPLHLSGRVLQPGGEAPAPGVVLYVHQTNAEGRYRSIESTGTGGRHDGMIQGWLRTDAEGRYAIETIRPAPYPGLGQPAHLHIYVKEPGRRPYYIDDVVFEDDPLLTAEVRAALEGRGGSGILAPSRGADGVLRAERTIVLEW